MENLNYFITEPYIKALKTFFRDLNIPINYIDESPASPSSIFGDKYNPDDIYQKLILDIYAFGIVDDSAFSNIKVTKTLEDVINFKDDYDGIIIFGITLSKEAPTRTDLAEITRALSRAYPLLPVTVIFRNSNKINFALCERIKYSQSGRIGEKMGKVSLLRDIDVQNPHRGHIDILKSLEISRTGKDSINSNSSLYEYWQRVFNVSILNKRFYKELQTWYFWAIKEVVFPGTPNRFDFETNEKWGEAVKEHKGKNVIRLLTRILFIWFIKEKKLIPDEIFDEKVLVDRLIKDFVPQKPHGVFATGKNNSQYYRAILQNLFFATLNQEMGKREFRKDGQNQNATNLMRYKKYFKDPVYFVELMENYVPFMNGGLFECLDKPHTTIMDKFGSEIINYIDGFSDREDNELQVPDYLFFDLDEDVDVSNEIGINDTSNRNAKTRGLLEILKSYKFTITENTPVEEDIALDPELLGQVFENLLASYNPETKKTARKQTGSFYTPREIVNFMVDESLIAYLVNTLKNNTTIPEEKLARDLHDLFEFNGKNPYNDDKEFQKQIIALLDNCTILDPACGSGAFPMGILQKMVHVLHKIDPNNVEWKQRQLNKIESIDDYDVRDKSINDIEEAFANNELDYGRKLYLIENCIYGIDIQPIATQISKLRIFISLIVDQKIDKSKDNFGVRPLPNLETKFVAANSLIGIIKPKKGDFSGNLFENSIVKQLEAELIKVRHRLFNAKTPITKRKLREQDKQIRDQISKNLVQDGWGNQMASQLAGWDPYDQNFSSIFFDPKWMFDNIEGFDVIIGNPPYIGEKGNKILFRELSVSNLGKKYYQRKIDIFYFFFHLALDILKNDGVFSFITTNYYPTADGARNLRLDLKNRSTLLKLINFNEATIFESAKGQHNLITIGQKSLGTKQKTEVIFCKGKMEISLEDVKRIMNRESKKASIQYLNHMELFDGHDAFIRFEKGNTIDFLNKMQQDSDLLKNHFNVNQGILTGADKITDKHINQGLTEASSKRKGVFVLSNEEIKEMKLSEIEKLLFKKFFKNSDVNKYWANTNNSLNLLYLTRDLEIETYPIIKQHVAKYKAVIENRSSERGEMQAALKLGKWWVVFAARDKKIFEGEKIISPQRSHTNVFAYNNSEWYSSADVYYITKKANSPIPIKYLLGLLNSSLYFQWLYRKGKRKGEMLELYGTPLENIPLKITSINFQKTVSLITSLIIYCQNSNSSVFQSIIDSLVYEIYFEDQMKVLGFDLFHYVSLDIYSILLNKEFDNFSDAEKEVVIEQFKVLWLDPQNEVSKRIILFSEHSQELFKPIL